MTPKIARCDKCGSDYYHDLAESHVCHSFKKIEENYCTNCGDVRTTDESGLCVNCFLIKQWNKDE